MRRLWFSLCALIPPQALFQEAAQLGIVTSNYFPMAISSASQKQDGTFIHCAGVLGFLALIACSSPTLFAPPRFQRMLAPRQLLERAIFLFIGSQKSSRAVRLCILHWEKSLSSPLIRPKAYRLVLGRSLPQPHPRVQTKRKIGEVSACYILVICQP